MAAAPTSILDSMKCPICLDFARNAVETGCCAQVYCDQCVEDFKGKNCPSCRKPNLDTFVNRSVRKMLAELSVECPNNCGETVTRATLVEHTELCPQRKYKCPITGCEFSGFQQQLAIHAAAQHPKGVVTSLTRAFAESKQQKVFYCPFHLCQNKNGMKQQDLMDHLGNHHVDYFTTELFSPRVGPIRISNSERKSASMARNGKFYCGRPDGADGRVPGGAISRFSFGDLDPDRYTVKKVACSYPNKLNCRSCMKLDVILRNLPYGSLVNGAGHVTKSVPCPHDVEGSEYFAGNFKKSALCQYKTCRNVPKFTCGMPHRAIIHIALCTLEEPCNDCDQLNCIYDIQMIRKNVEDHYGYVWEK